MRLILSMLLVLVISVTVILAVALGMRWHTKRLMWLANQDIPDKDFEKRTNYKKVTRDYLDAMIRKMIAY